ncbi:MAG: hypothetical protein OXI96_03635 [Acidimicrobiaceae bacterium]|nr:hypothetical protein [Acidimicrobiaceae bacterium]
MARVWKLLISVKRFWGRQPNILQIRAEPENGSAAKEAHRADELAVITADVVSGLRGGSGVIPMVHLMCL